MSDRFLINLPSPSTLEQINDKARLADLAGEAGIPIPATVALTGSIDLRARLETLSFPVIIKGRTSYRWRDQFSSGLKGYRVDSLQEASELAERLLNQGLSLIAQSLIPGPNTSHCK